MIRTLFWPTRLHVAAWGLFSIATLLALFIPLFNTIGYESAALFGVLGGLGAVVLTLKHMSRVDEEGFVDVLHSRSPVARFASYYVVALAPLAIPFVALWVGALFITNCDPWLGLAYWALIPGISVANGVMVGCVAGLLEPRWQRYLAGLLIVLAAVALFAAQLALEPPIVGFQIFLGYFSGSIYDEALALPPAFVAYRVINLILIAGLLALFESIWRVRTGRYAGWATVVALALLLGGTVAWFDREEAGVDLKSETIAEALGGRIETEHFVIFYPAEQGFEERAEDIAEDHEFRYAELKAFFETDPVALHGKKVRSYVYPDRERKGAMMGGRRTQVAKLWLHEIHILWREYGDHMLAHELAHVFTEPFGTGPLRLSTRWGVGINMGLVEGIATAADWPHRTMTPHEAAASLRRLDRAPSIRELLGASGFWTQSSSRAYTMVGSFIRFVVDEYGIDKLKKAYGRGEFKAAYGKSLDELVSEWEVFIDALELDEQTMSRAKFIYDRPSIFQKVCARTVAEYRRRARLAAVSGRTEAALGLYREMLSFDPDNLMLQLEYARFLVAEGKHDEATEILSTLVRRDDIGSGLRAAALELQGDVFWYRDMRSEAATRYGECLALGVPLGQERFVEVKRKAVHDDVEWQRELAFEYLLEKSNSPVQLFFPAEWVRKNPDDALANYLLGRRLLQGLEAKRALEFLQMARGNLGVDVLELENLEMLVQAHYFAGEAEKATPYAAELAASERSTYRESGLEWQRRIDWKRRNTVDTP